MVAKTRASTLQQRFGFKDSDLTTPQHDRILLWLDTNVWEICGRVLGIAGKSEWDGRRLSMLAEEAKSRVVAVRDRFLVDIGRYRKQIAEGYPHLRDATMCQRMRLLDEQRLKEAQAELMRYPESWGLPAPPKRPEHAIEDCTFEFPVMNGKYMIGFIDAFVCVDVPTISLNDALGKHDYKMDKLPDWEIGSHEYHIAFEIKSSIPSLGEVVRQINMYKEYQRGRYIIVSPDATWAKVLESQNIGFVEVPKGVVS